MTHENITPIIEAQEALKAKEKELQEMNVALRVLLKQREGDQQKMEEAMMVNIKSLILPNLVKLQSARLQPAERKLIEVVEQEIKDILSPFLNRLSANNRFLSPQEMRVAALIREGKTSKEIAEVLQISVSAVEFHRKQLRKKFELSKAGANLRTYLLTLH